MLLLAIRLPSSHRSYLYAILNLGETRKNDTRCVYIYMHSLRISIDEDSINSYTPSRPGRFIYLYTLLSCTCSSWSCQHDLSLPSIMVKTDHVAASPVEWKHTQTLIRFLILLNIFIRFYHPTLEKVSSIHPSLHHYLCTQLY